MWYYWGLQTNQLNVTVHNLRRFRVSSKHVAGSISEGVMCVTLMLGHFLSRFSLTSPLPHMSSVHPMPFAPCPILMRYRAWCKPPTLEVDIASTLHILHVTWYHDDFGVANLEGEWGKKKLEIVATLYNPWGKSPSQPSNIKGLQRFEPRPLQHIPATSGPGYYWASDFLEKRVSENRPCSKNEEIIWKTWEHDD